MSRKLSVAVVAPNYTVGMGGDVRDEANELGELLAGMDVNLLLQSTVGVNLWVSNGFNRVGGNSVCFTHAENYAEFLNIFKQRPDTVDTVIYCGRDYDAESIFIKSSDAVLFYPGNHNEDFYFKLAIDLGKHIGVIGESEKMLEFWNILERVNYGNVIFDNNISELVENVLVEL